MPCINIDFDIINYIGIHICHNGYNFKITKTHIARESNCEQQISCTNDHECYVTRMRQEYIANKLNEINNRLIVLNKLDMTLFTVLHGKYIIQFHEEIYYENRWYIEIICIIMTTDLKTKRLITV